MPEVLIGIVTRDRAEVVPKAIESALSQRGIAVRLSVVNDGSRDATANIALTFPGVDWIELSESRGYMAARNHWMINGAEKYFASLDDDAWFIRGDEITTACAAMEADERIAAVAFDILSPDRPQERARAGPEQTSSFIGCGHLLRLSAVRQVGGYEAVPGGYGVEEKDLCLRLIDAGYEIVKLPGVHVWHDKTDVARQPAAQLESGVCNDLAMAIRRTPLALLPAALALKFFRHLIFGFRHRRVKSVLRGFVLFFRHFLPLWRSRRPVKASSLRTFMQLRA
jgi:GT2 family glycosyltransferase